jgi:membrane-bound lytic murein transglycosylase D
MPETARGLGLLPDERIQPVRSARAAASYLRYLHDRFGDWPLALAAYNAGESRVARELKRRDADNFASIARHLPVVTRFYVPRVLATIKVREGVNPADLQAPTPQS